MSNLINLTKKVEIVLEKKNLSHLKAEVVVAIDRSGSMRPDYQKGTVQNAVERLLAVGLKMDLNQSMEVFAFNHEAEFFGNANADNYEGFVDKKISKTVKGGTNYAPVMNMILSQAGIKELNPPKKPSFFGKLTGKNKQEVVEQTPGTPTIVFFITDGDNNDQQAAKTLIQNASGHPVFWQFIGIGTEQFSFLEQLDNMGGRVVDNANFFKVNDINSISDDELYERILDEFPLWLKEAKAKNIIA